MLFGFYFLFKVLYFKFNLPTFYNCYNPLNMIDTYKHVLFFPTKKEVKAGEFV